MRALVPLLALFTCSRAEAKDPAAGLPAWSAHWLAHALHVNAPTHTASDVWETDDGDLVITTWYPPCPDLPSVPGCSPVGDHAIYRFSHTSHRFDRVYKTDDQDLKAIVGRGAVLVAVGRGTIVRSSDGGHGFTSVFSEPAIALEDIVATATAMVAVGSAGAILRSSDGGLTWTAIASHTSARLYRVWADGTRLLAAGDDAASHRIRYLVSTDDGVSWKPILETPAIVHSQPTRGNAARTAHGELVQLAATPSGYELQRSQRAGAPAAATEHLPPLYVPSVWPDRDGGVYVIDANENVIHYE